MTVPVEFSVADHERVWESTRDAADAVAALFTSSPRVVVNEMPDSGHNLSVGWTAGEYHRRALAFADECIAASHETGGGLMRVGFIGLGSQGAPMARRIVDGGYDLTLWARRPATLEPFADTAAKTADSPAELAAASDLVCICVVGDDDVREVLAGDTGVLAGLKSGGIVAIHSTVHPDTCRELAESAAKQGVSMIDAPVSGGGPAADDGHVARHGRRRRRDPGALPPGVRDLRRPDRAPRPRWQRAGHQDPEQRAVHRQPRQRDQHAGTRRIPWHRP